MSNIWLIFAFILLTNHAPASRGQDTPSTSTSSSTTPSTTTSSVSPPPAQTASTTPEPSSPFGPGFWMIIGLTLAGVFALLFIHWMVTNKRKSTEIDTERQSGTTSEGKDFLTPGKETVKQEIVPETSKQETVPEAAKETLKETSKEGESGLAKDSGVNLTGTGEQSKSGEALEKKKSESDTSKKKSGSNESGKRFAAEEIFSKSDSDRKDVF